jgi:hypothetical protein
MSEHAYIEPLFNPGIAAAPLNRTYLDHARTPLRVLFGLAFIAYSSIATIRWIDRVAAPAVGATTWIGLDAGVVLGVVVAIVVITLEFVLSEEGWWYVLPFAPDVFMTHTMTVPWVSAIIISKSAGAEWAASLAFVVSLGLSAAVAYGGEHLLFGKRRR